MRKRGEELAAEWLKGWEAWIKAGGGTVWGAMGKTLDTGGRRTGGPGAGLRRTGRRWAWPPGRPGSALRQNPVLAASVRALAGPGAPARVRAPGRRPLPGATGIVNIGPDHGQRGRHDPGGERLKAVQAFLQGFMLAEAATDPGATTRLQGRAVAGTADERSSDHGGAAGRRSRGRRS